MPTPTIALAQPGEHDLDVIHAYLAQSYWSPGIPRETVARSIAHSLCAIARDEEGALVGFARLVTDRATFGYVADVFVQPAYGGQGVARAMIKLFLDHPELQGFKRWMLGTRDAHGVYAGVGFQPIGAPERFMEIRNHAPYGVGAG